MRPLAWAPLELTSLEKRHCSYLRRVIRLAERMERVARFRRVSVMTDDLYPAYVAAVSLVRAIQLARGVLELQRDQAPAMACIRVLLELHVNLYYIECDPEQASERAKRFHDFQDVSRLRLLAEIAERFPKLGANPQDYRAELEPHRDRFRFAKCEHDERWDWDDLSLVGRVHAIAKAEKRRGGDAAGVRRLLSLYTDTNAFVHSGMISMSEFMAKESGIEIRPQARSWRIGRIDPSFLATQLLRDVMTVVTRVARIDSFDRDISKLDDQFKRFLQEKDG